MNVVYAKKKQMSQLKFPPNCPISGVLPRVICRRECVLEANINHANMCRRYVAVDNPIFMFVL